MICQEVPSYMLVFLLMRLEGSAVVISGKSIASECSSGNSIPDFISPHFSEPSIRASSSNIDAVNRSPRFTGFQDDLTQTYRYQSREFFYSNCLHMIVVHPSTHNQYPSESVLVEGLVV